MELVIVAAIGYAVWRALRRQTGRPSSGQSGRLPPPSGRPVAGPAHSYAKFSTVGREAWPPNVLKAVEGIFEVASTEYPTTVTKMRAVAKRLTRLGTPVADYLDPLVTSLYEALADPDVETPEVSALQELLDAANDLVSAEDEASDATDEVEVDVIGYAENFVDAWQKAPNP